MPTNDVEDGQQSDLSERAERTPGIPLSASTVSPESSATAGSPVYPTASRAFISAFSANVAPVSGASG